MAETKTIYCYDENQKRGGAVMERYQVRVRVTHWYCAEIEESVWVDAESEEDAIFKAEDGAQSNRPSSWEAIWDRSDIESSELLRHIPADGKEETEIMVRCDQTRDMFA